MAINTGDLNALYKVAYAKGIKDLVPDTGKLTNLIQFVPSELQNGKNYEQPVVLSAEAGFTYSLDTQDAYNLNDSIGMNMQSAVVPGADIVLDSTVGYNQAARASHSATSFKSAMSTKFENMLKSSQKRLEIAMLYGQDSIAQAAANSAAAIVSGELEIDVDSDAWATGIFSGSENALVVFSIAASGAVVDSLNPFQISKVDVDAKSVTVKVPAGAASTLLTLETAYKASDIKAHFYSSVSNNSGTVAFNEMAGIKKIMSNTASLFGIDAGVYDLWKGNTVSTTGALTMGKVLSAVSKAVQRGLDQDATVLVNPDTWADLASNLAALRRFDGSYSEKKAKNGSKELEYISQNGTLKIVAYNLVKEGDCFIFPEDNVIRIGARELSLNDPTRPQDEIFFTIPGKAGVGLRAYTNQAVFIETPAQCVYISGIQNTQS